MKSKILGFVMVLIFSLTGVLAYSSRYSYYNFSPEDILYNEWVLFFLIFAIFFALIFFALRKPFKENAAVPIIIAVALSLFISTALLRRYYLEAYIGDWGILIAILIIIVVLIRVATASKSIAIFLAAILAVLAFSSFYVDPIDVFPAEFVYSSLFPIYEIITSGPFLFILAIITIGIGIWEMKNKKKGDKGFFIRSE